MYATGQRDLFEGINLIQNDGYLSNSMSSIVPPKRTETALVYYEVQDSVLCSFTQVFLSSSLFFIITSFLF